MITAVEGAADLSYEIPNLLLQSRCPAEHLKCVVMHKLPVHTQSPSFRRVPLGRHSFFGVKFWVRIGATRDSRDSAHLHMRCALGAAGTGIAINFFGNAQQGKAVE
jgi:hypothetical protein